MPLVAHSELPAFETLRLEGVAVTTPELAAQSGLTNLRIGLLNLMPDAALRATDRQFIRLVSAYGDSANLYVYPFTVAAEYRGEEAQQHVNDYYETFENLAQSGLDALIVTGANPKHADLARESFWAPTIEVLDWGQANVHSILCSCLATHVVLKQYQSIERVPLPEKRWGVYSHGLLVDDHPLLVGLESPIDAPHSHLYDVSRATMESAGLHVLAESDEAGVHMAVSDDDFSYVFFQGHPEYDGISLMKEYKREVGRFIAGDRSDYPPYPEHYFDRAAMVKLESYKQRVLAARSDKIEPPVFPEAEVAQGRDSTWTKAGQRIYSNWLAEIERRVGRDRENQGSV
jgi:homoserine O-succinyltransferase